MHVDKFIYLWLLPFPCRQICDCHWIRGCFSPETHRLEGTWVGPHSNLLLKTGSAMRSDQVAWGCIQMGLENLHSCTNPLLCCLSVLTEKKFFTPGWPSSAQIKNLSFTPSWMAWVWPYCHLNCSFRWRANPVLCFPWLPFLRSAYICPSQHASCASHPTMFAIPTMPQFCDCMQSFSSSCLFMMLTWLSSGE